MDIPPFGTNDENPGKYPKARLTRRESDRLNVDIFQRTATVMSEAFRDVNLTSDAIHHVIVAGGSAQIPSPDFGAGVLLWQGPVTYQCQRGRLGRSCCIWRCAESKCLRTWC